MAPAELTAQVWCGKWFSAKAGELSLTDGRLRFTAKKEQVFDIPAATAKIVWHWYSASSAFETTVAGKSYFISFLPRGARGDERSDGMRAGRQWRAALSGKPEPPERSTFRLVWAVVSQIGMALFYAVLALVFAVQASGADGSLVIRSLLGFMSAGTALMAVLSVAMLVQELRGR